jgi:hypothetical protein
MLIWLRSDEFITRNNFKTNYVGIYIERGSGARFDYGTGMFNVEITVDLSNKTSSTVENPDSDKRPEVAIIISVKYSGMAMYESVKFIGLRSVISIMRDRLEQPHDCGNR